MRAVLTDMNIHDSLMRAALQFSVHHVMQFRPITCLHFEIRYNNDQQFHVISF